MIDEYIFDSKVIHLTDEMINDFHLKADNPVNYLPATKVLIS